MLLPALGIVLLTLLGGAASLDVDYAGRLWRGLSPGGSTLLPRHVSAYGDRDVLLVAGEDGLFFSGDNGDSWVDRSSRFPAKDLQQAKINPTDARHWVVSTGNGFYQSFNGGASWAEVGSSLGTPTGVVQFGADGQTVVVGSGAWTPSRQFRGSVNNVPSDAMGPVFAAIGQPRLFVTKDKGATWTSHTISRSDGTAIVGGIAISPSNSSHIWATIGFNMTASGDQGAGMIWGSDLVATPTRKLVRSLNKGQHWQQVPEFPSIGVAAAFGVALSADGQYLAVSAAMRRNGSLVANPQYNGTHPWSDAIYMAAVDQSTGELTSMKRVEGSLPSGGRYYRYLEFGKYSAPTPTPAPTSSTNASSANASSANSTAVTTTLTLHTTASALIGPTPGLGEGMQTGTTQYSHTNHSFQSLSWYMSANANTSKQPSSWAEEDTWLSAGGATMTAPTSATGTIFTTSQHGLYKALTTATKDDDLLKSMPFREAFSRSWSKLEGYTSRGWDSLRLNWVAVNPSNEHHMVVGASEGLGFESFNAGLTWENFRWRANNNTYSARAQCSETNQPIPPTFDSCANHTGMLDQSLAGGFVGNLTKLLLFGGARRDANTTGPPDGFKPGVYVQYSSGDFALLSGGNDELNVPSFNGPNLYTDQKWELTAVGSHSMYPDLAVVGFSNGMLWMYNGCETGALGDAPSQMTPVTLFGWSVVRGQDWCARVNAIDVWGNATHGGKLLVTCSRSLWLAEATVPLSVVLQDPTVAINQDTSWKWTQIFPATTYSAGATIYPSLQVHGLPAQNLLYVLNEEGVCTITAWSSTAVAQSSKTVILTHAAASAAVHSAVCTLGTCPTTTGLINHMAVLNSTTLMVSITGFTNSTTRNDQTLMRGVLFVEVVGSTATTTVVSDSLGRVEVNQLVVTSTDVLAVSETNGLSAWSQNWVTDGGVDHSRGWSTTGVVTQTPSSDSSHGLQAFHLAAGATVETTDSFSVPDVAKPLSIHFTFKYTGGAASATVKFFDQDHLPLSHKVFTIGNNTVNSMQWHSKQLLVYPAALSTSAKLLFNTSSISGATLAVDHIWAGPATQDTSAPSFGAATPYTQITLPYAPGVPVVQSMGGNSVSASFVTVTWPEAATTYSGPIWYYKVYEKQAGGYALAGITPLRTWTVTGLYRFSQVMIKVYAVNAVGIGPASDTLQAITPPTVPEPPTGVLMAAPSTGSEINLQWTAPADDGGRAVQYYTVYVWSSLTNAFSSGTQTPNSTTAITFLRLDRATNYKFKISATNVMGESAASAESPIISTTAMYEPTVKLRLFLDMQFVANTTDSLALLNSSLAEDLGSILQVSPSRFYIWNMSATSVYRMLKIKPGIFVTMTFLSLPTSDEALMRAEMALLNREVVDPVSTLHQQGIVTRSLDYGYWRIDWHDGLGVNEFRWTLGLFPQRDERLGAFAVIVLGSLVFIGIPAAVLTWLPMYTRLREEGLNSQEILMATLALWWKYVMLWKRRLKRRWDKHCQPWWERNFKCCRPKAEVELDIDGNPIIVSGDKKGGKAK